MIKVSCLDPAREIENSNTAQNRNHYHTLPAHLCLFFKV